MRYLFSILFLAVGTLLYAQIDSSRYRDESIAFVREQNEHYRNKDTSPLGKKERRQFNGHRFFDFNVTYVVPARFERIENGDTIRMKTSADTEKTYIRFAIVRFNIGNQPCSLTVYQSLAHRQKEEYKNHLFIPFKDLTSGDETYGGGRYLDLLVPDGDTVVLNFNVAYNPYCAYTNGYFCPIPPAENTLNTAIRAGAMIPEDH